VLFRSHEATAVSSVGVVDRRAKRYTAPIGD
jgi:hypothetical protein